MHSDRLRRGGSLVTVFLWSASACGSDTAFGETEAVTGTGASTGPATDSATDSTTGELCDVVYEGNLRIDETTNLDSVLAVRIVNGDLEILGVPSQDLQFLSCLEEVNGDMALAENLSLETLDGVDRLTAIRSGDSGGSLRIVGNPVLTSLAGLTQLQEIEGGVLLSSNGSLQSMGLPSLERIGQGLTMGGCNTLNTEEPAVGTGSNPMLTGFNGLDSLRYVAGLSIHGQENLTSLARLRELAEGGATFGSLLEIGINPMLSADEISAFVDAAGITTVDACQNKDDMELCLCLPD